VAGQRRGTTVDVDARGFTKGLERAVARIKITSTEDLTRFGLGVQNRARELCPVDTGRLRSSIQSVAGTDRDGPFVEVGTNVNYAMPVEFGTSKAKAQPFLRPALAEEAGSFRWTGAQ
jgi:HK97 gp10 family phage protein